MSGEPSLPSVPCIQNKWVAKGGESPSSPHSVQKLQWVQEPFCVPLTALSRLVGISAGLNGLIYKVDLVLHAWVLSVSGMAFHHGATFQGLRASGGRDQRQKWLEQQVALFCLETLKARCFYIHSPTTQHSHLLSSIKANKMNYPSLRLGIPARKKHLRRMQSRALGSQESWVGRAWCSVLGLLYTDQIKF